MPSTNSEAAQQARRGAPEGTCVIAREQTKGRGREGREWISPRDAGLYFSIVLRPDKLSQDCWPLLSLMAALAVKDAIKQTSGFETDIKWPNDILANERKLCGILSEAIETADGRAAVVGIGINLDDRAFPPELKEIATSVSTASGRPVVVEDLLRALVEAISHRYAALKASGGAATTIQEWMRHSSFAAGRRVRVSTAEEVFEGTTRGLQPDGALRVETEDGNLKIVHAGDVHSLRPANGG